MTKRWPLTLAAALTLAGCGSGDGGASAKDDDQRGEAGSKVELIAFLGGGSAEVPSPGDPDGSGTARVAVDTGKGEVCYEVKVGLIVPAVAAHIHEGRIGTAGPIVVTLKPPTPESSSGCLAADKTLARSIAERPTGYYVNVHNDEFPGGAVRGQLRPASGDPVPF